MSHMRVSASNAVGHLGGVIVYDERFCVVRVGSKD